MDAEAELAAARQRCVDLEARLEQGEAARKDLEAAAQDALDEAQRWSDAAEHARADLELCKLDFEQAQLEREEERNALDDADERKVQHRARLAALEAETCDALSSDDVQEWQALRARVASLEAERQVADELDELHGQEVDALQNDKEALKAQLHKVEGDAIELGRAASCLAAERDDAVETNAALKARVFDLESDLKSLRKEHKSLRRESSSMERRVGDPGALRRAEARYDSSRIDAFAAEARLLACRAAVDEEDMDVALTKPSKDIARGVLLAKARVLLATEPARAFGYYARGASASEDLEEALASLESLRPLTLRPGDDAVAAAFATANAVAQLACDVRGPKDGSARQILRELDLWRDEAPNDRGDSLKAAQLALEVAPAAQAYVERLAGAAPGDDLDAAELVDALRAVALAAGATLSKAAATDDYAALLSAAASAFSGRPGVLGAITAAKAQREARADAASVTLADAARRVDAAQAAAAAAGARRDAALRARRGADERAAAADAHIATLTATLAARDAAAAAPAPPPSPPPPPPPSLAAPPSLADQFFALAGVTDAPPPPPAPRDDAFAAAAVDALLPALPSRPAPPRHADQLDALARRLQALATTVAGGAPVAQSATAFLAAKAEAEALLCA